MKPAWLPNKTNENNWTKEAPEVECVICLFPFDNTQNTKTKYTLKCQHSFHTEVNTSLYFYFNFHINYFRGHLLFDYEIKI